MPFPSLLIPGSEPINLAAILDAIPDLLFELGLDGRYYSFQGHRKDLLALPPELLIGRLVSEVLPPDASSIVMAAIQEAHQFGRSTGKQFSLRLPHGDAWFELSVASKAPQYNQGPRFIVLSRDITESRRTQQELLLSRNRERARSNELATLLKMVPTAIWIAHDPECRLITGNKLADAWIGVKAASNISPASIDHQKVWKCKLMRNGVEISPDEMPMQLAATGHHVSDAEFSLHYRDGSVRHVHGNAVPLRDVKGRITGAIAAFIDITARKEAETQAREARKAAEQSSNAKSRFLAAASHDLRQPLSAMSLYLKLLQDEVKPSGQAILAKLTDCVGSLSTLLNDLLDLSKLDAGVVVPNISNFAMSALLTNLESLHTPEATLKNLRFRCRPCQKTAHTDPILFKRILDNLISNAIRYTHQGAVMVTCRRRSGKFWVEVRDSGVGISAGNITEIFEEFRQLDCGGRTRGSGLGLAIVAKTAKLLGLEITVRSSPGAGSVFSVEFPLGSEMATPPCAEAPRQIEPLCIALVEDNEAVRDALTLWLQSLGHSVIAAASGSGLYQKVARQLPDIVVSDYRLAAGETGYDAIQLLRERTRADLPAILITGDTDPAIIRSMADRGIAVLHKPLVLETLLACLDDLTHQGATLH